MGGQEETDNRPAPLEGLSQDTSYRSCWTRAGGLMPGTVGCLPRDWSKCASLIASPRGAGGGSGLCCPSGRMFWTRLFRPLSPPSRALSSGSVSGLGTLVDPHPHAVASEPGLWNQALPPPPRGTCRLIRKDEAYFLSMVTCGNEACRKPRKIDGSFHY